jgi:predicted HicB family RNase H-like nuclease
MKHVNVRLPDEVHLQLEEMAAEDRRSLNSMVVVLIEAEHERRQAAAG